MTANIVRFIKTGTLALVLGVPLMSLASVDGEVSGKVLISAPSADTKESTEDVKEAALSGVLVQLLDSMQKALETARTDENGEFHFYPVLVGDYTIRLESEKYTTNEYQVKVESGGNSFREVRLVPKASEMVMHVKAKKKLLNSTAAMSRTEVKKEQIEKLPMGTESNLPDLIASTSAGVVAGPFGQLYFRGNHANIQYQIDGVQLPDSPSVTFGQTFSPRNIEHMEVITGGLPAEYGQRLAAVVNIVTRSGSTEPDGEIELNYGSYDTISPHLLYGGANESGNLKYFFSLNYNRTNRGLDTPQPVSETNQLQGGRDSIHNLSFGDSEFFRIDWQANNSNKLVWSTYHSNVFSQIPNYPTYWDDARHRTDTGYFGKDFADVFGNEGEDDTPAYNYVPSQTDNNQRERNFYTQLAWKHTFNPRSFLQTAPYFRYSRVEVNADPSNDLFASGTITNANPTSFWMSRHVNTLGLKTDYTLRASTQHLLKMGFQVQAAQSAGYFAVQRDPSQSPLVNNESNWGFYEGVYIQDDFKWSNSFNVNMGLRYDATQFVFAGIRPTESMLQPRIGLNYLFSDSTKAHFFYGKLFQPAPLENLRTTFNQLSPDPQPYDIKAEKIHYFETGLAHQLFDKQLAALNVYYKVGTDFMDNARLLRTPIAQPFNFADGFGYGVELSLKGEITPNWSNYFNYSYAIAKGRGINGGAWAGETPSSNEYVMMDHIQRHTANAGFTYSDQGFWWTIMGLFGTGFRTGEENAIELPNHFTMNSTIGYEFKKKGDWYSGLKVSLDALNIFDNRYPITLANAFNGSYYAPGRQFFVRVAKEL